MTACIGEPISWLRLEAHALGATDQAIAPHLAACPACRQCLDHIRGDVVALPPLIQPGLPGQPGQPGLPGSARAPRRARRWWLAPAFAAAAAAVLLLALWPRAPRTAGTVATVGVKGVGDVSVELVRKRGDAIRHDARRYAPGDVWKVVVTCPPSASAWIDVSVSDGVTTDHPLPAAQLACGNRVVVPGAFTVTGDRVNRVCAAIAATEGGAPATACLSVSPEPRGE